MRLKNRFKNRFVSRQHFIEWFTAKDFRAGVICTLARFERLRNFKNNFNYESKYSRRVCVSTEDLG